MRAGFTIATLLAASMAQAGPAAQSPKNFVEGLYATYNRPDAPNMLGKNADTIFSPSLLSKIRADQAAHAGEVGKLDHDPLCDCQDADGIKSLSVYTKSLPGGQTDAAVHFKMGDMAKSLHLRLAETPAGWRVDDVSTATTPSLQKLLAAR